MELIIDKKKLYNATSRTQGTITDKTLAQIGLKADKGGLEMLTIDRILAIYSYIDCQVLQSGTVFVQGRLFNDVVKQLPDSNVKLYVTDNFLVIVGGSGDEFFMKLPIIENSSWKTAKTIISNNVAEIDASKLRYMIEQIQYCIDSEASRDFGKVAYLHRISSDTLRMVGSDGLRLSYCDINMSLPDDFLPEGICLSKRVVTEIFRMASEGFDTIKLAIDNDQKTIVIQTSNYKIYARLTSISYPKYQHVIPKQNLFPINVSRNYFQNVTRRVLLAADVTKTMRLNFSKNILTLSANTLGLSESKEDINIHSEKELNSELIVNGKFLSDVFSVIPSEKIEFSFKSENEPIIVKPINEPSGCGSMHLLVPISENN